MSNFDTSTASYNDTMRMLEPSDPCHADTFNVLFGQLLNNTVALYQVQNNMASGFDDPGLALRLMFLGWRYRNEEVNAALAEKVDMTDMKCYLDVNAPASSTDGRLTAALEALGWLSEVTE